MGEYLIMKWADMMVSYMLYELAGGPCTECDMRISPVYGNAGSAW